MVAIFRTFFHNYLCLKIVRLLTIFLPLSMYSQETQFKFSQISIEQGLSQTTVTCILQSKKGFIWFGTADGLNRYDGYGFTIYRHDPDQPGSLSHNLVSAIFQDRKGNIWVGTESGGLNLFDSVNDMFKYIKLNKNENIQKSQFITSILEDNEGNLWVGTDGNGLNKLDHSIDVKTAQFRNDAFINFKYDVNDKLSLSHNIVWTIFEDSKSNLWIGTNGGLNLFNRNKNNFTHYKHDEHDNNTLSHNTIWAICEDYRGGALWIGTYGGGLNLFDRINNKFIRYKHDINNNSTLGSDFITTLFEDTKDNLWVGTDGGGLNLLDRNTNKFIHYKHDENNNNSLSNNVVRSIFEDRKGDLWIGTYTGGVNLMKKVNNVFRHYHKNESRYNNSLSHNSVFSFFEDSKNNIWVGTDGGGLNLFDRKEEVFTHYQYDENNKNSLSDNAVLSMFEDSRGNFWIGTYTGGLNLFNRKNNEFIYFKHNENDNTSLNNNSIWAIYEDTRGNLWLGTNGGGLNLFDRDKKTFAHYKFDENNDLSLSHNDVRTILEDSQNNLWIGTFGHGLNLFDRDNETFLHYEHIENDSTSLSNNLVISISEDSKGNLWIGTYGGGLNLYHRKTNSFTSYREKDGLINDIVCGILEDSQGNLWLSTNRGISKFNPTTRIFKNFTIEDGLQSSQFNRGAYLKTRRGEMFFGGINGFNSFYPESVNKPLPSDDLPPRVVVTDFRIFNKPVRISSKDSPLKKHISETKEIVLSYKQSVFSFEFVVLNYAHPSKNQYAYKLEGFDKEWNKVGSKRIATYTNLPAGDYIFRVNASHNGVWSKEDTAIKIIITPPFWKNWWFKSIAGALILALVFSFYKWRIKGINEQNKNLEYLIKVKTQEIEALHKALVNSEKALTLGNMMEHILVPYREQLILVPANDILYIKSQKNYSLIITHSESYLQFQRISILEKNLSPQHFFRIHRSYIINVSYIDKIETWFKGGYRVILTNGKELPLSRRRAKKFKTSFGM